MTSRTFTVIGIDYSYTCPAVCVHTETHASWYVHYKKTGKAYPSLPGVQWSVSSVIGEIPRYLELAAWVVEIVRTHEPDVVVLEDYAFGANGRLTQLSENAGTLKVKLYETFPHVPLHIVAPTTMKKFATGRGTAKKEDVWASFIHRHPEKVTWTTQCHPKATRVTSPLSDIADAYFLAYYGHTHFHPNEKTS